MSDPRVEFIRNNLLLIVVALVSGGMLIWPLVRRGTGGPYVDAARATQLINREDALVVDVRDPGEYGAGHILGARNVPVARIDEKADLGKRKDRPLIVYCDTGSRASKAAAALRQQGFTRVVSLSGGLGAWQQAGLPIEKK
jgi:rhodanese-related sulfurtransferase